ncbi:MAG: transposase, partial [Geminicoccaceae bacterium]
MAVARSARSTISDFAGLIFGSVTEMADSISSRITLWQFRARWPRVKILLRAGSGFARDELMTWCEATGVDYVFGLARNERLVGAIADDLAAAEAESLAKGSPARRFADFACLVAGLGTGPQPRS